MTQKPLSPLLSADALNECMDSYNVEREIGRGAMGVVYEAKQSGLGRRVALKVLPPELALREQTVKRFVREAEAMGRLAHPCIVDIFEVGSSSNNINYFAMRFVEGPPLDAVLGAGVLSIEDVLVIGIDVADALAHAHSRGVMHRDIKPSNLLRDGERVVLTDFGLARPLDSSDSAAMTASGDIVGTPLYMSPEQIGGDAAKIDGRADIWSLGATLYEFLAKRPPFRGTSATSILNKILHKDPPLLRKSRPDVPRDLEAVVLKCLEKDPTKRYATASDLADDLRAVRDGQPVTASAPHFYDPVKRWLQRHPTQASLFGIAVVVIGALGALSSMQESALKDERGEKEFLQTENQSLETEKQQLEGKQEETEGGKFLAEARQVLMQAQRQFTNAFQRIPELKQNGDPDSELGLLEMQRRQALEIVQLLSENYTVTSHPKIAVETMTVLGSMLAAAGQSDSAESILAEMGEGLPPFESLLLQAALFNGLGKWEEALQAHRARTDLMTIDPRGYLDMGIQCRNLAQRYEAGSPLRAYTYLDEAVGNMNKAFELTKLNESLERKPYGRLLEAEILSQRAETLICASDEHFSWRRPDWAHRDLEEALELDPSLIMASVLIARIERATPPPQAIAQLEESNTQADAEPAAASPSFFGSPSTTELFQATRFGAVTRIGALASATFAELAPDEIEAQTTEVNNQAKELFGGMLNLLDPTAIGFGSGKAKAKADDKETDKTSKPTKPKKSNGTPPIP